MDPIGARLLAARIKAGVSVGTRIELVRDSDDDSGLCAGDRGIVEDIDVRGFVRVALDRGDAVGSIPSEHRSVRSRRNSPQRLALSPPAGRSLR
jgi:hypothetical protein